MGFLTVYTVALEGLSELANSPLNQHNTAFCTKNDLLRSDKDFDFACNTLVIFCLK